MAANPHVAKFLHERGIPIEDHDRFLHPSYDRDCHDPFLFDDMQNAVLRLLRARDTGERITIYGDYDVDGVTAAVLLYDVLSRAGASVELFFNHREHDGYGVHRHCIDIIADAGARVIITTDSGISNATEIAYANERGIDTIITDHHTPPATEDGLPPAYAIIHPAVHADRYPWKFLSGGGSAFKLAQALCRTFAKNDVRWEHEEKWHLDLVALSILADRVPLLGENRVLLHYGLKILGKTRRPGLRALLARAPEYYRSSPLNILHFGVIPLLNAASRMDHAVRAADVLIARDDETAQAAVDVLYSLNRERQRLTKKTIKSVPGTVLVNRDLFLAASPHWHVGVLGLVASKLLEEYHKPVILIRDGSPAVGVARSTPNVHITQTFALLSDCFDRFGGHHAAGGFALKTSVSLEEFAAACERLDVQTMEVRPAEPAYDCEVSLADLTPEYVHELALCKPWGQGNREPRFLVRNCTIVDARPMGSRGQWLRLSLEQHSSHMNARVRASMMPTISFSLEERYDIIVRADITEWHGMPTISLTIDTLSPLHYAHISV